MTLSAPLLLVLANGDSRTGHGHVRRCLSLAHAWKALDGDVHFVGNYDAAVATLLGERGMAYTQAPPGEQVGVLASQWNKAEQPCWIVVDSYDTTRHDYTHLREACRASRIVAIEDYARLDGYSADVLLTQTFFPAAVPFSIPDDCLLLAGPGYALLGSSFGPYAASEHKRGILVTLGGADPENVTPMVIEALQSLPHLIPSVMVAIGDSNLRGAELQSRFSFFGGRWLLHCTDLAPVMQDCALAITAGGSTCLELASMGVPQVIIETADNQQLAAAGLAMAGAAVNLGWYELVATSDIAAAVSRLMGDDHVRGAMASAGRALVDGQGCERVCKVLQAVPATRPLGSIRPANRRDALSIWRISNHPAVRSRSFNTTPIPWDDHVRWLECRLSSEMSRLFVYDLGLPVGQLRLDRVAPDLVDISFSVHPTFHGKGVGRYLLEHASALVPPEWQARWLRGFVLEDNLASLRLFETTGFQGSSCPRADGLKCRVYQRPLSSVEGCQAEGVSIA